MRSILILCFIYLMGLSFAQAREKIALDKQFPVMAWAGIPENETNVESFQELKEMGININLSNYSTADAMEKALDVAEKVGIQMIASCPELKIDTENTVKRFLHHPALFGYFLMDEPVRKDFDELGKWAKKISSIDSVHICFVNLIAGIHPYKTDALGTKSYAEYVSTFINEVPVQLLSFDFYPVLNDGVHERWYESLGIFSDEARKASKPFWAFALASSYNGLHPVPTLAALRLQMFSNLAYGAQGLEYWAYRMNQSLRCAPIGLNGKRTDVYDLIKTVNNEIQLLAGVFSGAKVISVQHTGLVIPRGTSRLTKLPDEIKVFETSGTGMLVSVLENGENTFFVIVNRDLQNSQTITILGDKSLKKVLKDGTVVMADRYEPTTRIEPGDISVFMFPTKKTARQ